MANTITSYWLSRILIWLVGACLIAFIVMYRAASVPPLKWSASEVYPSKVKAGDVVAIRREYEYVRSVFVTITRRMETGNCATAAGCISFPMDTTQAFISADVYNKTMFHRIPTRALPGKYRLIFSVSWEWAGLRFSTEHPVLEIEVIP